MRKFLAFIFSIMIMLVSSPVNVNATELADSNTSEIVSLISPPNGLTPAKGDGSNETEVIQAILDYATAAKKTILIPKNYTFVASNLSINNADHFTIQGYGTLKNIDGASNELFKIENCSDFLIDTLNTDGNVEGNKTDGERINQYKISTKILKSHDFKINSIHDVNPAGDSLYLNDVENVTIGTITATADEPSGRNALSIIKAQNVTVNNVISENIGVPSMPGGIDLEPNDSTDDIQNVTIKSATIRTSGNYGCSVGNGAHANVKNIEINAVVTRFGNPDDAAFCLQDVDNFKGNIECYQEGSDLCIGASITESNYVDANLELYNSTLGLELGKNCSNINLKGKIIGTTTRDGIAMWDGVSQGTIDMEIKQVAKGTSGSGVIKVGSGQVDNLVFKGDYSFDQSGGYCFRVDGDMKNCRTEDLKMSGWTARNQVIGDNNSVDVYSQLVSNINLETADVSQVKFK